MFFEPLQGWGHNHLPGQPIPMPDHSFSKKHMEEKAGDDSSLVARTHLKMREPSANLSPSSLL